MNNAIIAVASVVAALLIIFFIGKFVTWLYGKDDDGKIKKKHGLKDIKAWFVNHRPSKRRLIQVYAALLYNANIKGYISGNIYQSETTKYMCVPGLNCYSCPGAVGACPLGALQNALSESKTRAPYYVLGILALFGIILARTVCGFLCPVGLCQELLYKVRTPKLKKSRVTRILSYFKYVLLALLIAVPLIYTAFDLPLPAFCKYICPAGTFEGAILLLANANNANLFVQLGWQFTWKFSLLIAFVVASMFIYRVFCRFICPLGAIYGFFNKFALIGVTVDKQSCTDCGLCVGACKMDIRHVNDHECINCGECISVCPVNAIHWKGSKLFIRSAVPAPEKTPELKPIAVSAGEAALNIPLTDQAVATADTEVAAAAITEAQAIKPNKQEKRRKPAVKPRGVKFWLETAAWTAAMVLLVTALVLYNFVDLEKSPAPPEPPDGGTEVITGYNVGDTAPDFTVALYGSDGSFNLYDNRGRITVINFWATWCTSCVAEIPYFNELQENHHEIDVIAIHGLSTRDVPSFITIKGWDEYSLTFAQDNLNGTQCLTFGMLGGTSLWPMTVIVDGNGKVIYNSPQSFSGYSDLEEKFNDALKLIESDADTDTE